MSTAEVLATGPTSSADDARHLYRIAALGGVRALAWLGQPILVLLLTAHGAVRGATGRRSSEPATWARSRC